MKKVSANLFFMASVVILLNTGCGKYEDGPNFSLRTKKARLSGEWEVVKMGGSNVGSGYEVTMEFEKDGDFKFTYAYSYGGASYSYTYDGEWEWEDKKEKLDITVQGESTEWEINRLTNSEFWFDDEDNTEWKCEKK